ncbi:hypothetical protein RDWZM_010293 [Blomia tropicalis]|uniref:Uncharacterized protein n=1 Tax=Blomia tropicalis TaxID=40697 RepID=A0A9Q0LWH5_BLOTA|nr:hypothetical protein RDWZM_010293 [Blomia tropicalis]
MHRHLGAIFPNHRRDHEIAFQLAIKRINADRVILPNTRLIPKIEEIEPNDSFHADKKVCGLLRTGVVAIFDPINGHVSHHLQSICDAMDIPHIVTRWDFKLKKNDLSINLYPRPLVLARAYVEIVKAWNWEQFVIVYEENEGLFRLQDFFKEAQQHNWRIKLHRFDKGQPYRETFWKIKDDGEHNIILDVKNENIFQALKHAQQVGLITESHSYLITQLDLHTIDLEDFKFGKTKISAFTLIDNNTEEHRMLMNDWKQYYPKEYTGHIATDSALLYDAVRLLATAIQDLDQSQSIEIHPVSCETATPWAHGSSLINYMRPIQFRGITGLVRFNDLGFRSSITLGIVTVTPDGLEPIGTWTESLLPHQRLNISHDWNDHYSTSALQNKTLIITTVLNDPYTMIKDSSFKRTGNDQFEGYAIDLIAELAKLLHFKYEFRLVKDSAYGRPDKNGIWSGMMGELIRGEADLAVADLTITSKREEAVDFTHPFMNTGISILFKKPTKKVTSLFSFLSPFSNVVWIYVLCAYIGVSSMLFLVGRLSPYEWENPHPCRQDEQVLENGFSLSNSFWFTIGSLMQQASDLTPKAMSTRTIAAIWYFFTLIMIASYTANLAAFLTVEKIVYPIENAEGLSAQEKIAYGCLGSGSTASFFAESNITTYKRMWEFMSKHKDVFKKSNDEGRKAVEKGDGSYAYLMESASIEYIVERNCNLTQIGGLLDSKGYGVATAKDSPYRMPLSEAILKLQESGELLILKERWWKQRKGGGQCIDDSKKGSGSVTPLKIDNVGGVFVVLLGGLTISLAVAILEFVVKSKSGLKHKSIFEEMIDDLKFALMCQSSSKFVNRHHHVPPNSSSSPMSHHSDGYYGPASHILQSHQPPNGQQQHQHQHQRLSQQQQQSYNNNSRQHYRSSTNSRPIGWVLNTPNRSQAKYRTARVPLYHQQHQHHQQQQQQQQQQHQHQHQHQQHHYHSHQHHLENCALLKTSNNNLTGTINRNNGKQSSASAPSSSLGIVSNTKSSLKQMQPKQCSNLSQQRIGQRLAKSNQATSVSSNSLCQALGLNGGGGGGNSARTNGSRVRLNVVADQIRTVPCVSTTPTAQSNSCSDLIINEPSTNNKSMIVVAAAPTTKIHNRSMRSLAGKSNYSQSFDEEMAKNLHKNHNQA